MKANLSVESLLVLLPGVSLDLDLDPGVVGVLCNLYYFLRDSPLYKLFRAGWVQKGVGGIFLKIRPHSCV